MEKSTETLLEGTHREDRWICTSLYIYIWNLLVQPLKNWGSIWTNVPSGNQRWQWRIHPYMEALALTIKSSINGWFCGWKKPCTTLDDWNPVNNGINHLSAGARFLPSTVVHCYVWWTEGLWNHEPIFLPLGYGSKSSGQTQTHYFDLFWVRNWMVRMNEKVDSHLGVVWKCGKKQKPNPLWKSSLFSLKWPFLGCILHFQTHLRPFSATGPMGVTWEALVIPAWMRFIWLN